MNIISKALFLIPKASRKWLILLQVLFFVTALFQVAGIASIAPFIAMISNPVILETNSYIAFVYDYFGFQSDEAFLIFSAIAIGALILVSNAIAAFSLWYLFRFSVEVGGRLQTDLFGSYLASRYELFAQNNSSKLMANITQEIPRFVYMVFQPALHLVAQSLLTLLILITLIVVDPLLAFLSLLVVCGIYCLIYFTVRKRMQKNGATLTEINREKLLLLSESLKGIKEVKLLNVESWYCKRLSEATYRGLRASAFINVGGELPRFIVETFVFIAILVLAAFLFFKEGTGTSAITTLSFYAMAGYKLLPAVQMIYKSLTSIRANRSVVDDIFKEFSSLSEAQGHRLGGRVMPDHSCFQNENIIISGLSYRYPMAESPALDQVTCVIKKNAFNALVGGSGAGKSTLADILLGLLEPAEGEFSCGDVKINRQNLRLWQARIGYVPQSIFLVDDTVERNIAFGIPEDEVDRERVLQAARMAQLEAVFPDLSEGLKSKVGESGARLSGGQVQRIGIARALYKNPDVLIFDEATSALDNVTEAQIISAIRTISNQKTVIMIAHRLSTIIDAENIILLEQGRVMDQGSYDELYDASAEFRRLVSGGKEDAGAMKLDS